MGKSKAASSKKQQHGQREVTPDVHNDKLASNMLSFKKLEFQGVSKNNKTRSRAISKGKFSAAKKKPRVYTEKELGIPKLNTALNPIGVKVKGKKGKKFVDESSLQLILAEVQQESNEVRASKLERARQLEVIRETKRKEIEEREQRDKEKLGSIKKELKSKPKRTAAKVQEESTQKSGCGSKVSSKGSLKKRVSFAT